MPRHSKRNNRRRSPSRKAAEQRSFGRTLVWAFLLAIVFSVGLIAGQRMLDQEAMPPFVAISSMKADQPRAVQPSGERGADDEVTFSFYERLGQNKPAAPPVKSLGEALGSALDMQEAEALPARYTLQVGAHPSMEKARQQVARLGKQGVEAHVIIGENSEKKGSDRKVYRVRVGKFHSMDEARQFQGALKSQRELDTFLMPL